MEIKEQPSNEYIYKYREAIGKNLRYLREKRGYSQRVLGGIMNVHRSTISKIEKGRFAITVDYLAKFGWHLDFDITVSEKTNLNLII